MCVCMCVCVWVSYVCACTVTCQYRGTKWRIQGRIESRQLFFSAKRSTQESYYLYQVSTLVDSGNTLNSSHYIILPGAILGGVILISLRDHSIQGMIQTDQAVQLLSQFVQNVSSAKVSYNDY